MSNRNYRSPTVNLAVEIADMFALAEMVELGRLHEVSKAQLEDNVTTSDKADLELARAIRQLSNERLAQRSPGGLWLDPAGSGFTHQELHEIAAV